MIEAGGQGYDAGGHYHAKDGGVKVPHARNPTPGLPGGRSSHRRPVTIGVLKPARPGFRPSLPTTCKSAAHKTETKIVLSGGDTRASVSRPLLARGAPVSLSQGPEGATRRAEGRVRPLRVTVCAWITRSASIVVSLAGMVARGGDGPRLYPLTVAQKLRKRPSDPHTSAGGASVTHTVSARLFDAGLPPEPSAVWSHLAQTGLYP